MRRCPASRCPTLIPDKQRYCDIHAREYEERRGSPAQRGYDKRHRHLRQVWAARIARGEAPACTSPQCGEPILPGQAFDLGHDENRRHRGPEHVHCNRSKGGRNGAAARTSA